MSKVTYGSTSLEEKMPEEFVPEWRTCGVPYVTDAAFSEGPKIGLLL